MEMKALIAMFSLLLVLVILGYKSQSKDENQLDNFHRLATISGCLNKVRWGAISTSILGLVFAFLKANTLL